MRRTKCKPPIAVCQNRIEMLLDDEGLNEQQMGDLIKVRQTLQQLSRPNKSLLMLCRIENGHFSANEPQKSDDDNRTLANRLSSCVCLAGCKG